MIFSFFSSDSKLNLVQSRRPSNSRLQDVNAQLAVMYEGLRLEKIRAVVAAHQPSLKGTERLRSSRWTSFDQDGAELTSTYTSLALPGDEIIGQTGERGKKHVLRVFGISNLS